MLVFSSLVLFVFFINAYSNLDTNILISNQTFSSNSSDKEYKEIVNDSCITSFSKYEVRGSSLSGLIEPGSCILVAEGYYNCNDVKRGEVVAYNYRGNNNLIIKIVKAIPGDSFSLNNSRILVNGEILRNTEGKEYIIRDTRMLSLYTKDYPIIPEDTFLILGNLASGSLDSSRFGLISKQDIRGRVFLCT